MKKCILFIVVILISTTMLSAQIRSNRDLLGKWTGPDMQVEFFSDGKVIMIVPGGTLPPASYKADFMKMPVELNITLTDNGQKIQYKGNLKFLDNDTIKLEYFGDDKRYDAFAKGRELTLKRNK